MFNHRNGNLIREMIMTFRSQIEREIKTARKAIAKPEKHTLSRLAIYRNFLRIHAGWE